MENKEEILENEKLGYQSVKLVAAFLFILGLILLAIIYSDFIHRDNPLLSFYFDSKDALPELADSLLGSTGLCWSLAGTLLFFYTILQTRQEMNLQIKEMKITNNSLITQRNETTFFNLLDNQKSILNNVVYNEHSKNKPLSGSSALGYIIKKINKYLEIYNQRISNEKFESLDETYFNQTCLYQRFEVLSSVTDSIVHIIEYIIEKLENSEFHHKTLYYNLTNDEKYIIGLVLNNKIRIIPELKYNYSQYYLSTTNFQFAEDGIPVCDITVMLNHRVKKVVFTELADFENKIKSSTNITFISDEDVKPIMINSTVSIEAITGDVFSMLTPIAKNSLNHHNIDSFDFNFYYIFNDYLLGYLKNSQYTSSYEINIKNISFVFKYKNKTYEVKLGDLEMNLNMQSLELQVKFDKSQYIDTEDQNIFTSLI